MQKTSKSRGVTAVQGTNDSSIVSKCSMSKHGYHEDRFLHYFVCKEMRRAPLINRGYFIRTATVEFIIKRFIEKHKGNKQIISLGAGFDSAYFRLQSCEILEDTVYCEVDFPDVVRRKRELIYNQPDLLHLISGISSSNHLDCPQIEISGAAYKLLGVDLTRLSCLQSTLKMCDIDFSVPTLVLSEVVLTYMNKQHASAIIRWTATTFSSAVFVLYEQINPHDDFGLFMQKHFKNIGSKLKCLQSFPTLESQKDRFRKLGWSECEGLDMSQFYYTILSTEERRRVNSLEPFDEFEGWHSVCSHYFVLCAYIGNVSRLLTDLIQERDDMSLHTLEQPVLTGQADMRCEKPPSMLPVCVYGHQSVSLGNNLMLTVGGFGEQNGRHCRAPHVVITDSITLKSNMVVPHHTDKQIHVDCMYSSIVSLKDGSVLLIYGRFSPAKPYPHIVRFSVTCSQDPRSDKTKIHDAEFINLTTGGPQHMEAFKKLSGFDVSHSLPPRTCGFGLDIDTDCINTTGDDESSTTFPWVNCTVLEQNGDVPGARWRHTCTVINLNGEERIFLCGGRNQDEMALDDCFLLDPSLGTWSQLPLSAGGPGKLHSHTATECKNTVVISGGLDIDLRPLNSVFILDVTSLTWRTLAVKGMLCPRYSHTAHVISCYLILIGGCNMNHFPPGVAVIHIPSGICQEFPLPQGEEENIMMLYGHTSIDLGHGKFLIIGGGGNCFSFGTHMNKSPFIMDISECLLQMNKLCEN